MKKSTVLDSQSIKKSNYKTEIIVKGSLLIAISVVLKMVFEIYIPIAGIPALRINFTDVPIMISGILFGPLWGFICGAISDILCYMIKSGGAFFPGFTLSKALVGCIPGLIYLIIKKHDKLMSTNFYIINIITAFTLSIYSIYVLVSENVIQYTSNGIIYDNSPVSILTVIIAFMILALFITSPYYFKRKYEGQGIYGIDKLMFTVTITNVITSLILNTIFLSTLYGSAFMLLLPLRIVKSLFVIPLFTIILFTLIRVINKNK